MVLTNQTYDAAIDAFKDATRIKNDAAQPVRDEQSKKGADGINLKIKEFDEENYTTDCASQTERES
jgi:hypothetical protein